MKKSTVITIILISVIFLFGGLSFLIVVKLNQVKTIVAPKKTKAADLAYSKVINLKVEEPTAIPTSILSQNVLSPSPAQSPAPTQIQLLTTPIVTAIPTLTRTPTPIISPTGTMVLEELPQTGLYSAPLFIFLTSIGLIALAFVL